jgi:hypothetical protein
MILAAYGCIFTSVARMALDDYGQAFDRSASAQRARQNGPDQHRWRPDRGRVRLEQGSEETGIGQRTKPRQPAASF